MAKRVYGKEARILEKKIEEKWEKEKESKRLKRRKTFGKLVGAVKPRRKKGVTGKRKIKQREVGTKRLLTAMGVIQGKASQSGPGRPRGTYKYGMPIHEWKKLQAQKKQKYRQYQLEQMRKFQRRGITPEQLREMQLKRAVEQGMPQQKVMKKGDEPGAMADDELAFKRWEAEKTLSPSAERILTRLRRVQNKGKVDNIRQQRIHEERRIISQKANMFKAHENMVKTTLDFTGVSGDNILMAPSVFKENPEDNILKQKRPSILNTKEMGNDMGF